MLTNIDSMVKCSEDFTTSAETYLSSLTRDDYFNNHSNYELSRILDRITRLRFELQQLRRIME